MERSEPVDLRSDTVTRPTRAMREAMAAAEVGDDVLDGDPTVRELEERTAALLEKEDALFFPSGTQANQAAVLVLSHPGTEVVCEEEAHVFHYELAAPALFSGVQLRTVPSERGAVSAADYEAAVRGGDRYHPRTSLLCLENTHNLHGGTVVPAECQDAVGEVAARHGLPVHLDGARLWNAAVASGTPLARYTECADTVMVALSKGLGCPVGSVLAGSAAAMEEAWVARKRLGGGMRQAGILAAAGLHALEHHVERLGEDHRRAARLAEGCREIEGVEPVDPDTNIVMLDLAEEAPEAAGAEAALAERGVRMIATGERRLRAVTHLDVDDAGVERAVEALREIVAGR